MQKRDVPLKGNGPKITKKSQSEQPKIKKWFDKCAYEFILDVVVHFF